MAYWFLPEHELSSAVLNVVGGVRLAVLELTNQRRACRGGEGVRVIKEL